MEIVSVEDGPADPITAGNTLSAQHPFLSVDPLLSEHVQKRARHS
jgi:hypothetical protein